MSSKKIFSVMVGFLACVLNTHIASAESWTYTYDDDFSTDKATTDSYDHSIFWPESAIPPPEPYLFYTSVVQPQGALAFAPYYGQPAHLNYRFPLEPSGPQGIWGAMELEISDLGGGYLAYSISGDGDNWALPMPLGFGHQEIGLFSGEGTAYVSLTGYDVAIDDVHVTLIPEPSTALLLAFGLMGLAVGGRRRGL